MPKRLSGWLLGAAAGVLFGGILAMDAVADAQAATLVVSIVVDGAEADGTVQIRTAQGAVVSEGPARDALRVRPGTYEVLVSCPTAGASRVLAAVELATRATTTRVVRFRSLH